MIDALCFTVSLPKDKQADSVFKFNLWMYNKIMLKVYIFI